jgi:hypothetical protein
MPIVYFFDQNEFINGLSPAFRLYNFRDTVPRRIDYYNNNPNSHISSNVVSKVSEKITSDNATLYTINGKVSKGTINPDKIN